MRTPKLALSPKLPKSPASTATITDSGFKEDAEYAEAFKESHQEACDNIEAEMRRRAIEGVQKPVFYKGEVCGYITEYSDTMLAMLANGFMPEKYKQKAEIKEREVRVAGAGRWPSRPAR